MTILHENAQGQVVNERNVKCCHACREPLTMCPGHMQLRESLHSIGVQRHTSKDIPKSGDGFDLYSKARPEANAWERQFNAGHRVLRSTGR